MYRLLAAFVLTTAVATPAIACGPMPQRERVTGFVDAFDARLFDAIRPTYTPTAIVIVQYPRFAQSKQFLYQGRFNVNNAQVARLADALRTQLARGHRASLSVTLEQVGRDEWRLVSWSPSA